MIELYLLLFLFSLVIYTFTAIEHYFGFKGKDWINLSIFFLSLIGSICILITLSNISFFILGLTFIIVGVCVTIKTTKIK